MISSCPWMVVAAAAPAKLQAVDHHKGLTSDFAAAAVGPLLDLQPAAVHIDQGVDQRQTEARALARAAEIVAHLAVGFERRLRLFRVHTDTGIDDGNAQTAIRTALGRDFDATAAGVNLMAFDSKLNRICRMRSGSARRPTSAPI